MTALAGRINGPVLAVLGTVFLTGATVAPGEEGPLKDILPPEPGTQICFARSYDAAHLAKHPKQKVTDIKFHLAYFKHEVDGSYPEGQRNYYFALLAKRRGEKEFATAFGECSIWEGKITCGVDCDGGGVNIEKAGEGLGITFGNYWGISLTNECGSGDVAAPALEPGEDDKEFRLTKSDDCPKYEDW